MRTRSITPRLPEAYRLFHEGTLAFAEIEANGIRVDTDYLERATRRLGRKIERLEGELKQDEVFDRWRKRFGDKTKIGSLPQLGKILFEDLGHTPIGYTEKSYRPDGSLIDNPRPRADEEAILAVDIPFTRKYGQLSKYKKAHSTYFKGLLREVVGGYVHPVFNLHLVETMRSCIAKGTLIETVRDVSKHPKGIPIEDVRAGDHVYCYDDELNLTIKKVLWAGKTGHRKVIRLHWSACGKKGHLDLTPEHRVRLASGKYVRADQLIGKDRRSKKMSKHAPKVQVMAMGRVGSRLFQTNGPTVLDHRLVYECLVGKFKKEEIVHHEDRNHLNNLPDNLEKMTPAEHARLHCPELLTDEARRKGLQVRIENHRRYGNRWKKGEENCNRLAMTKYQLLKVLARASGKWSRAEHESGTILRKAADLGVGVKVVKDRYDREGKYITLGRLKKAAAVSRSEVKNQFGLNFYKTKRMMEQRGFSTKRKWGNQFEAFIPGNHKIIGVEEVDGTVDVYDLEVEDYHNFIANEICVHNSSDSPNFQNIPIRDPEIGRRIRQAFVPRRGRYLAEIDYSAMEWKVAADFWKDPNMVCFASDPRKDVHRDLAMELFLLDQDDVCKKTTRDSSKNMFVFPILYGSDYIKCSKNIWDAMGERQFRVGKDNDGVLVRDHLRSRGITSLGACDRKEEPRKGTFEWHVRRVENRFMERFPVFAAEQDRWWAEYQAKGWFELMTGFVVRGVFTRNFLMNCPIQGPGFHCLLWSLIEIQKYITKHRMRTKLVGQIHDCILADAPADELQEFLSVARHIMTEGLQKAWSWVIVPMEAEVDVVEPGSNWAEKKPWVESGGVWRAKAA